MIAEQRVEAGSPAERLRPALALLRRHGDLALLIALVGGMFLLPNGLPPGIIGLGLVSGLAIALQALGVILVYRSTRIINFAQTSFGVITAVWFYLWVEHLQWVVLLHHFCASCVPWVPAHAHLQDNAGPLLDALIKQSAHNGWAAFLLQFNFWFSLALALSLAVVSARGIGWVTTRFWSGAPRLVPTVAMLGQGLAIFIGALTAAVLREYSISSILGIWRFPTIRPFFWWPYDEKSAAAQQSLNLGGGAHRFSVFYAPLANHRLKISGVPFDLAAQATVVLALVLFGALYLYFRYSRSGVVIRGLSENADRAKALGVDSDRLVHRTWAMAGLLSGVVGALAVLGQGFFALPTGFDLTLLAAVLTVAVFARLSGFGRVLLAGVGLGVINQAMFWNFKTASAYDTLLLGLLAVALLLQTRRASRSEQESAVAWLASPEIRPTPRELRRLPSVNNWMRGGLVIAAILVLGLPFVADPGQLVVGSTILIEILLGLSLLLLTGWAGQVSLGQVALAAIGAYVAIDLSVLRGVPLPLALLGGSLAAAIAAALVGIPALRLRGPHLVVITLVFTIFVADTVLSPAVLGGRIPFGFPRPLLLGLDLNDEHVMYYFSLAALIFGVAALLGMKRSRTRRALIAARDNEPAAQVFGLHLVWTRLEGFAVSGFLAGLAGGLLALETHGVRGATFSAQLSVLVFLMIVIGGAGSLAGPVIGGSYLGVFSLLGSSWVSFATGAATVGLLQYAPGGLGSLFFKARDAMLRRVAIRNRISVPSLLTDFSHTVKGAIRAQILPKRQRAGGSEFVPVVHRMIGPGPGPVAGSWLGTRPNGSGTARVVDGSALANDAAAPLLSCQQVDVHYDQAQALFKVDFDVRPGEIVALVGINGAGKTTLLRAIAGLHHPSGGVIHIEGKDVTRTAPHLIGAAGVITVPTGGGVFPSLTVEENLRVASWANPAGASERVSEMQRSFPRLRERLTTRAGDLSGGEQQMLALAQAFVVRPRLLMIDELSLGLSPQIVQIILELLRQMRDDGAAIVIVEQSLNLTLTIAERAYVLEKGEVRYSGSARQLLDHPDLFQAISFGAAAAGVVGGSELARRRRQIGEVREIALSVAGVRTSYGGVVAVDGVSLDVAAGEVVGIIGPNGAGKTSLFDVISGFQPAERGSIFLFGADVTRLSPTHRATLGLQRSFQSVRLFPSLTVRDNIAVALETKLKAKSAALSALWLPPARSAEKVAQQRVDMLIELMGLEQHEDQVMSEISTGTRRVVDIACQLAARPKVLLLDEPSSGLAQTETEALGPIIMRISKDLDCALLIIEHDISLVSSISARLVAMDLGRPIAVGAPDTVLSDPTVRAAYFGGASEDIIHRSGQRRTAPATEEVVQV